MESMFDMCGSPLLLGSYLPELKICSTNSMEEFFNKPLFNEWPSDQEFLPEGDEQNEQASEHFLLELEEPEQQQVRLFDLSRKVRRPKKKPDYKKNICGYVTKRTIRECLSDTYRPKVQSLCTQNGCTYEQLRSYYLSKIEYVTGPRHLPMLLVPEDQHEVPFKAAFRQFFQWFIKQRYVRYLIIDGKMTDKKAYIKFKNEVIAKYFRVNAVSAA